MGFNSFKFSVRSENSNTSHLSAPSIVNPRKPDEIISQIAIVNSKEKEIKEDWKTKNKLHKLKDRVSAQILGFPSIQTPHFNLNG